jgi:ABC-type Mn2+/Zn2+ transport system permease subunit
MPAIPSVWGVAPRNVAIFGWLQEIIGLGSAALGAFGILVGLGVATVGIVLVGLLFLVPGVALFYFGYSMRRAKPWAWKLDLIAMIAILAAGVIAFFLGVYPIADWILVLVFGVFIYYLLTPSVRDYFSSIGA